MLSFRFSPFSPDHFMFHSLQMWPVLRGDCVISFRLTNRALYLVPQMFWTDPRSDKPPLCPDVETRGLIGLLRAVKCRAVIHQRLLLRILLRIYGIFSIIWVSAVNGAAALSLVSFMHQRLVKITQIHFKEPDAETGTELLVRDQLTKQLILMNSLSKL